MTNKADMAREILDYLGKRPDEQDTFEGIADWFMRMDKGAYAMETLKAALDILVETGDVEKTKTRRALTNYRVKKRQTV